MDLLGGIGGFYTGGMSQGGPGSYLTDLSDSTVLSGSMQQGNASQAAAEEQLKSQQQQQAYLQSLFPNMNQIAAPTAGEISNLDTQLANAQQMYGMQFQQLTSDMQLAAKMNPALAGAAQQAAQLLSGQDAPVLGPLKTQIASQRAQLQQSLQSQFGSGYASSSAGMQALNQFDQQSQMTLAQAQQSYTGQLLGITVAGRPNVGAEAAQAGQTMSGMSSAYAGMSNQLQQRQLQPYGMLMQGTIASNPTQYQGADQVAAIAQGKANQAFTNYLMGGAGASGLLSNGQGGQNMGMMNGNGGSGGNQQNSNYNGSNYGASAWTQQAPQQNNSGSSGGGIAGMGMMLAAA